MITWSFVRRFMALKRDPRKRAKELLKQFSLDNAGKRTFKAYSKGMKRKLTIAAGIIHNPEILFLDEPTTGIDVESARQIRKMIKNLNDNGTTIFLTTHYIEEAERLCHRIGFIVEGKIIKLSNVHDLLIEARQENIVEFDTDSNGSNLEKLVISNFPGITVKSVTDHSIRISSRNRIEIMPFMKLFDNNGIKINEAKVIRPSLEEVFIKITGIEIDKLHKEKEGKRNEQNPGFWSILAKDMKNYYLKPPNISWGIIFPVSWTLMFLSVRTAM